MTEQPNEWRLTITAEADVEHGPDCECDDKETDQ
jgi:hypothetical protein